MASSLEPIYQKVETKDVEEVELEEFNVEKKVEEKKCCDKKQKCQRAQRTRRCGKCCALSCCAILLATVFVLSIALGVASYKVKHCVYPSVVDTKTYTFDPKSLDLLELNIPTGSISVHTCPHAKNVTVHLSTGAKTAALLQEFILDVTETKNSFSLKAKGPSFDLQSCQIMHVSVVVPASSTHPLSLTAKADVGYIALKTKSYTFNNVDLNVAVGVIRARKVSAANIKAEANFGGVMGCTWNATNTVSVRTEIGGACVSRVNAKQGSISIDKGVLRACTIDVPEWSTTVNYGCVSQKNINAQVLNSEIHYGRMCITPSAKFSGTVSLVSSFNTHLDVSARRGLEVPAVIVEKTPESLKKMVKIADESGKDGSGVFNLKSSGGSVYLFVTNV